jgi:hypothetical protein
MTIELTRRGFLGAILAAGIAPAIVRASSIMPLWLPRDPTKAILTWPEATLIEMARDWQEIQRDAIAAAHAWASRGAFSSPR